MKKQLDQMLNRAVALHGHTLRQNPATGAWDNCPSDKAVAEYLTTLASIEPDEKKLAEVIVGAWKAGPNSPEMTALNALRVEQVGNYIAAESMWASAFFERVPLADNEEPYVDNMTSQEIRVGHVGEDGTPDAVRVVKPESRTGIALRFLMSQKVRYKVLDVYRGRVAEISKKQFDIARDLRLQLDYEHYSLLTASVATGGAFGAFSTENGRSNKAGRIYVAHSRVTTSRLPSTNDWNITSGAVSATNPLGTTSAAFGVDTLRAVEHYANLWADLLPDGGRLVPTGEIIIPSNQVVGISSALSMSSNTASNSLQQQVADMGYAKLDFLGRTWRFIPDATYCPTDYCFPRFNLLPGKTFMKPSFDKEFVTTNEAENWEERYQRMVYGAHVISQHRPRALRIKFA